MGTPAVVWHGTEQESSDLVDAVTRNCACVFDPLGGRRTVCAPHRMLVQDQRALNGLLFARRIADRLRREEWTRGNARDAAAALHQSHEGAAAVAHHEPPY